jgi:hypothetical protein
MQARQCLLRLRLHGHGTNSVVAKGLEQPFGIRAIRLVAQDIRAHGMRRDEHDGVPVALRLPCPVVRRATRFHDDNRRRLRREEPAKLGA